MTSESKTNPGRAAGSWGRVPFVPRLLKVFLVALVLGWTGATQADTTDDEYLRIYDLIQKADALSSNAPPATAIAKYREVYEMLQAFQRANPQWNSRLVATRLQYLAARARELSQPAPAPDEAKPAARTEASPGGRPAAASGDFQVKLLDPGAEPRKELRLQPKAGDQQTLVLTLKLGMETKVGETQTPAIKLPPMRMTMDVTVKEVTPEGDIRYEMVLGEAQVMEEPDAMPAIVDAMKQALAGSKGAAGSGTITSRGLNRALDFKSAAGAEPQMRQVMDQMKETFAHFAPALPEEAVGPGAKWEVRMPFRSQGLKLDQTATYQLVSFEGDRVVVRSSVMQRASNQKMENPAMPGLKVDLSKMTGQGNGQVAFNLAQLLPEKADMDLQSEFAMSMNMGGQKQAMTMKMGMKSSLESKPR
ncbi:MAG TPA: DUF6263 family protein [Verrucomicrobiota bacterium]|nr:DUF6263 family protein [Verrucomicrobiota bacterium]HRT09840.1 DUF6263 family protein [Candidatus Paceibacterota bacterium]HRT58941.1 DUF6263 family protein [Candidatus Paceibacterota bacterium]